MHIGLVGLGKMGGNMRTRLRNAGHTVVGYDRNPDLADVGSLADMVAALPGPDGGPRVVWVMVPAGDPTRETVKELGELLGEGDLVVDGGNSKYTDDAANAEMLGAKGIGFVDCGVSGGVWGLENGYALMCGGSDEDVAKVQPALDALRPEGEHGFVHAGQKPGAGHFAKMVHNGIEYAMMQAYAEGWELLEKVDLVDNVTEVFDSWRAGTVIRSWLLDLLVAALEEDTHLDKIAGYAEDSGMPLLYRDAPLMSIWEGSGNVAALDVLRAMAKEPEGLPAFLAECELARGADARFDAHLDSIGARLAGLAEGEVEAAKIDAQFSARRIVEDLGVAFEASLLLRHAPPAVADGFCAGRLGEGGRVYGTLPRGVDTAAIVDRVIAA